ncbi:hypothetical protein VNO77_38902 [Canavalia gladiata]|uniref:Uncharacterized protein n=1 Tax=Canavalia gladiata TaxID=3824 RepID=A0AAN9KA40_CANGL
MEVWDRVLHVGCMGCLFETASPQSVCTKVPVAMKVFHAFLSTRVDLLHGAAFHIEGSSLHGTRFPRSRVLWSIFYGGDEKQRPLEQHLLKFGSPVETELVIKGDRRESILILETLAHFISIRDLFEFSSIKLFDLTKDIERKGTSEVVVAQLQTQNCW